MHAYLCEDFMHFACKYYMPDFKCSIRDLKSVLSCI